MIGRSTSWVCGKELLKSPGVDVVILNDPSVKRSSFGYIKEKLEVVTPGACFTASRYVWHPSNIQNWNEDMGNVNI